MFLKVKEEIYYHEQFQQYPNIFENSYKYRTLSQGIKKERLNTDPKMFIISTIEKNLNTIRVPGDPQRSHTHPNRETVLSLRKCDL